MTTDVQALLKWLRYERIDGVPDDERRRQCAALIERQAAELEALKAEATMIADAAEALDKRALSLQKCLRFYAEGQHFHRDPDGVCHWESVSGEPENFLCDEHGTTVEDGTLARMVLEGKDIAWDEDVEDLFPDAALRESRGE